LKKIESNIWLEINVIQNMISQQNESDKPYTHGPIIYIKKKHKQNSSNKPGSMDSKKTTEERAHPSRNPLPPRDSHSPCSAGTQLQGAREKGLSHPFQ
jgi:hypothetical protein